MKTGGKKQLIILVFPSNTQPVSELHLEEAGDVFKHRKHQHWYTASMQSNLLSNTIHHN